MQRPLPQLIFFFFAKKIWKCWYLYFVGFINSFFTTFCSYFAYFQFCHSVYVFAVENQGHSHFQSSISLNTCHESLLVLPSVRKLSNQSVIQIVKPNVSSPLLSAWRLTFSSTFQKEGDRKGIKVRREINEFLSRIFAWIDLLCFL